MFELQKMMMICTTLGFRCFCVKLSFHPRQSVCQWSCKGLRCGVLSVLLGLLSGFRCGFLKLLWGPCFIARRHLLFDWVSTRHHVYYLKLLHNVGAVMVRSCVLQFRVLGLLGQIGETL